MPGTVRPVAGDRLGDYTIEALIGRGGMGSVYLARHERLGRNVALKLLAAHLADDESFRARFLRESRLAASLDHPNVIPIYDAGEIDGVLFLAMRYVNGPTLQTLVRERGPLAASETSRIIDQLAGALDAAHAAGLVHRDVKPANVLIAEPELHVYLCDFGLARETTSVGTTQTGTFLGTLDYASPEALGGGTVDGRADVYALAGVVHYCLTAQPPFVRDGDLALLHAHLYDPPPAPSAARREFAAYDRVVAKGMAKEPASRYETAADLATDLQRASAGETVHVADAAPTRRAALRAPAARARPSRRGVVLAASLVAALVVGAAVAVALSSQSGGRSRGDARLASFVERVENVLAQSAAGREEIAAAIGARGKCAISAREAAQRIGSVADNRQSILEQLGVMQAPTAAADDAVNLLQQALQQSIEADRHYRDAFQLAPRRARCGVPRNGSFALARAANARATATKRRFVAAFNPLARRFKRRTWSAGGI